MQAISIPGFARSLVLCAAVAAPLAAAHGDEIASPLFGVTIPAGYRAWAMIAPSHQTLFDELCAILGNASSVAAYRDGALPFPDGAVLVKLAWKHVPLAEFAGAFVPGPATTVQVMVKDSKRYATTGGWGFGKFVGGQPVSEAEHERCFGCHQANASARDFVFTRIAP